MVRGGTRGKGPSRPRAWPSCVLGTCLIPWPAPAAYRHAGMRARRMERLRPRAGMPRSGRLHSRRGVRDLALPTVQRCWQGSPWASAAPDRQSTVLGIGRPSTGFLTIALQQGTAMLPQRQPMAQSGCVCPPIPPCTRGGGEESEDASAHLLSARVQSTVRGIGRPSTGELVVVARGRVQPRHQHRDCRQHAQATCAKRQHIRAPPRLAPRR